MAGVQQNTSALTCVNLPLRIGRLKEERRKSKNPCRCFTRLCGLGNSFITFWMGGIVGISFFVSSRDQVESLVTQPQELGSLSVKVCQLFLLCSPL